jgi:hypothetical protein
MADVTNALGFRKMEATLVAALYWFATLHGPGGSALSSSTDAWTGVGMAGELATGNGYTQGGLALGQGTVVSDTYVDTIDGIWNCVDANLGPASYAAIWCNTTNTMTGAKLVEVRDSAASPQTATPGNTMTGSLSNPIQY